MRVTRLVHRRLKEISRTRAFDIGELALNPRKKPLCSRAQSAPPGSFHKTADAVGRMAGRLMG